MQFAKTSPEELRCGRMNLRGPAMDAGLQFSASSVIDLCQTKIISLSYSLASATPSAVNWIGGFHVDGAWPQLLFLLS
jgi:hypothetical protein